MDNDYDSECDLCKVFSNPGRLRILECLKKKNLTVSEIIEKTKLSQSVVSQHLSMMKLRDILETERDGNFIHYKIKYPEILEAFEIMKKIQKKIKR